MRKRWEFSPGPFIVAWFVLGLVTYIVVAASTGPCTRSGCGMNSDALSTAAYVALAVWLGPFAVGIVGGLAAMLAMAMWDARPRRVTEPVTTDLREHTGGIATEDEGGMRTERVWK